MKIFVINLKKSTDRKESIIKQLSPLNIDYEFFEAINGREGLPEDLIDKPNDLYRKLFRSRPLSDGEKGVYASNYNLWKKCIELNEPIVIFEDDIIITPFFISVIEALPKLHKKYDFLKLEPSDSKFKKEEFNEGMQIIKLLDNSSGAVGYSLTPHAAKQFLKHSQQWYCAIDNFIGETYKHHVTSYSIIPYAVAHYERFENAENLGTTIQLDENSKAPLPLKFLRELHRFYRFIRQAIWNHFQS